MAKDRGYVFLEVHLPVVSDRDGAFSGCLFLDFFQGLTI
jgi:hypothetical protein